MKIFNLTLFFTYLSLLQLSYGQCPQVDNLTFFTQQSLDNFIIEYPNCTNFLGNIIVDAPPNNPIENLSGLNNLSHVGGYLKITDNGIQDLSGLEKLKTVSGDFDLYSNDEMITLSGLDSLIYVGGNLRIASNVYLENLTGLENLDSVGGHLRIEFTNVLSSLSGLESISYIGGTLSITSNLDLEDISALANLTTVGGSLGIYSNELLPNLLGLDNVTSIGGDLGLVNNSSLTDLSALENLSSINGQLNISYNEMLQSITPLSGINYFDITELVIKNNSNLSFCSESFICNYLITGLPYSISDNVLGCNNVDEIHQLCGDLGKIYYPLFYDLNENGMLELNEPFLPQTSVIIEPNNYVGFGNLTNGGIKYLWYGDYTITVNQTLTPLWEPTTPASYSFSLDSSNNIDTVYFGLTPTAFLSNVQTTIVNGLPRCNEFVTFDIITTNQGSTITDGIIWLTIDENIQNINYIDTPDTLVLPNRYGWHFTELYPGQQEVRQISIQIPGPPDFPVGGEIQFLGDVVYTDQNGNHDTKVIYPVIVQCSYDPNDKLVSPTYPENYALIGEDLVYTIRFQNTGNAEAYDVVIQDELDSNLDVSTFQYIASSHESVLSTFMEGNMVTFEFRNIFLPDSTTNFDESQGYVMFRIRADQAIEDFTAIENTADIYFDFNPPIVTNTTQNSMVSTFDSDEDGFEFWVDCDDDDVFVNPAAVDIPNNGIDEDCDGEDLMVSTEEYIKIKPRIFPNPTSGTLHVVTSENIVGTYSIKNLDGNVIQQNALEQHTVIDLSISPQSVFLLLIETKDGVWIERIIKL